MKKFLPILFVFLFFLFSPQVVRAEEAINNVSKRGCIDIKAAYEEVNVTSKAITGEEKSLDSWYQSQISNKKWNSCVTHMGSIGDIDKTFPVFQLLIPVCLT